MAQFEQWSGFNGRLWKEEVNVRDFIQNNYTPYEGDESFLVGPTEATDKLWGELQKLQKEERAKGGVLDMDTDRSSFNSQIAFSVTYAYADRSSTGRQHGIRAYFLLGFCQHGFFHFRVFN